MIRFFLLMMLFYASSLFAQSPNGGISLYDGMYSKEWEKERDEINNDKSTPMATDAANKKWIMNGGLHPEVGSEGIRSGYRSKGPSTGTKSSSYSSEFLERRREAMERAREEALRKERERKERIARENAADFRNGYNAKMASSSAYYQEKYVSDKYKMGEGARKMDQSLHGMDFASMPEVRTDTYEIKEENELLDILQNGIDNPQHVRLHVNADGYYDSVISKNLVSDKVDEALSQKQEKEAEEAKLEAMEYMEELKKSNFDFSSLLSLISVKNNTNDNESGISDTENTEEKSQNESDREEPLKRQRTYEEYLYEMSQNGGKDFTNEDWAVFRKMIAEKITEKKEMLYKELDKKNKN